MALGQHLVRELGFDDGVNTLGRWMAHHVAELLNEAEQGATKAERLKARKQAVETILKIWRHREALPGKANPLTPYKDILPVLNQLRPNKEPFRNFGYSLMEKEQLVSVLFHDLAHLIITILLMRLSAPIESADTKRVAVGALSKTEQSVLKTFEEWSELVGLLPERPQRKIKHTKSTTPKKINLNEAAIQWIDNMMTTLATLKEKFQVSVDKE